MIIDVHAYLYWLSSCAEYRCSINNPNILAKPIISTPLLLDCKFIYLQLVNRDGVNNIPHTCVSNQFCINYIIKVTLQACTCNCIYFPRNSL